ncbi:MAG: ABC-2 family transporter protein [Planctomycetota bacterium]
MWRYARLYVHFLRFSFSKALEFRVDFFFRVVMDGVFYLITLGFFGILFQHTKDLAGWDIDQVLIFVASVFFVDAVHMTVVANNLWAFPDFVNKGQLDYYLIRPVAPLFFLTLREFAANSFLNLFIAIGILTWSFWRYPGELGIGPIALHVVLLLVGVYLHTLLYLVFLIPVFWLQHAEGSRSLFFGIELLAERPHRIYQGALKRILLSVIPFAVLISQPTYLLFEGATLAGLGHIVLVTAGLSVATYVFWRIGLRAYSSASS